MQTEKIDKARKSFATFFIDKPVFAWVISLLIMIAGGISVLTLPVAQYPNIAPPAVTITATYAGASASVVENTVTQVIENKMKGLDHLMYMSSTSQSTGQSKITLTFQNGTDPDIAQMQVQNKLQLATASLPEQVQKVGISVTKSSSTFLKVVAFVSTDKNMDRTDIGDYINSNIIDRISRLDGVGDVTLFGAPYAMRIWLDPNSLKKYNLSASEVMSAITTNNAVVTAGQLGDLPAAASQPINVTVNVQSRLEEADEFENIIVKSQKDGTIIKLKDVAVVEIGAQDYSVIARYNRSPASGIGIMLTNGANALDVSDKLTAELDEMSKYFPDGLKYVIPYDTTPFVKASIDSVVETLFEAIILVVIIMFIFLGNIRATLIPAIAVPVVLLGTFGVLALFGYSINTLTMFAMVLAIGLLVDDAIVVVENVERIMEDEGLSPKEATRKSMNQISSALIGIGLVLSAVFIPMAFFPGSSGVIYRQFSVTIVASMALSVLIAFILSPALAAHVLKAKDPTKADRGFSGWFNRNFKRGTNFYGGIVKRVIKIRYLLMIVYIGVVAAVAFMYLKVPSSFLPNEDQGMLMTQVMMPAGATQSETLKVIKKIEDYYLTHEKENIEGIIAVIGFNFSGSGQNSAMTFIRLKDWSLRERPDQHVSAIVARSMMNFSQINEAMVFAFSPPAVPELGNATGFDFFLQDNSGIGREALYAARNKLLYAASTNQYLTGVRPNGQEPTPALNFHIDKEKASAMQVSIDAINNTLGAAVGGVYLDDFIHNGKVKKVYVQAGADFRMTPQNLNEWYVKTSLGDMVEIGAFSHSYWSKDFPRLERYNGQPAFEIVGDSIPSISSGAAMMIVEKIAATLPKGVSVEWTGLSYEEAASGNQALMLYALSILVVFLALAALYESWSLPFSVMLIIPLGILGVLISSTLTGHPNDIYFKVGLLAVIGLATKNAILIVEFSKELVEDGMDVIEASLKAAMMRLRPILMTSLAFGFGVLPLALSSGVGSGAHNAIGDTVLGGMLSATTLGIFFVPMFFVIVEQIFVQKGKKKQEIKEINKGEINENI